MSKKEKPGFLLYKDRKALVDACTPEQAGVLFKGIYAYACGEGAPEFEDPLLLGVFEMFRQAIDADTNAWESKRQKAIASIEKRWNTNEPEPEGEPDEGYEPSEESTDEYERIRTYKKNTGKGNGNGKGKGNGYIYNPPVTPPTDPAPVSTHKATTTARTVFNACLQAYPITEELKGTMETWLKYKTERRESYKEQGLKALMKKASAAEKEHGTRAVVDIIEESMANRYQGITWDRIGKGRRAGTKNNQFTQGVENNNYDFDALEADLVTGNAANA